MKKIIILIVFFTCSSGFSQVLTDEIHYPLFENCVDNDKLDTYKCFSDGLTRHIDKYLRYPIPALENNISGKVMVTFTINEEGFIENISAKGVHELLEKEVIRVMIKLPQLKPALENNYPIAFTYTHPVVFRL